MTTDQLRNEAVLARTLAERDDLLIKAIQQIGQQQKEIERLKAQAVAEADEGSDE